MSVGKNHINTRIGVCCLFALLSYHVSVKCQDLSTPRFFKLNFQSLSSASSPLLPQTVSFVPGKLSPNYLIETSLRFPIKLQGNTKIFSEIAYKNELMGGVYNMQEGEIDELELVQTSGSIIVMHYFNEKVRISSALNVRSNSTQSLDFSRNALSYNNITLLEKETAKGKIGIGSLVSADNQRFMILPLIKWKTTLGKSWALDLFLPSKALLLRNFSASDRLFFGAKGSTASYFLHGNEELANSFGNSNYRRINVNGVVGYERQLTPWVGLSVEMGASIPVQAGIYKVDDRSFQLHNFNDKVTPHFNIGFFLSLPNSK